MAPKKKFSCAGKLYLLDATFINLCLAAFPWAEFRQKKGATKLHVGLDADSHLPLFMDMTHGKEHEINFKGVEQPLRLVAYTDPDTGIDYRFVPNAHHLKAREIADIDTERWKIEFFFKWIKQNLKIKTSLELPPTRF